jgi:hypothetical protein
MPSKGIKFRPKSSWQREDCINRSAEYQCPNRSTLEAVTQGSTSGVRCCEDAKCKKRAIELASAMRAI